MITIISKKVLQEKERVLEETQKAYAASQTELLQAKMKIDELVNKYSYVIDKDKAVAERNQEIANAEVKLTDLNSKYINAMNVYQQLEREMSLYQDELEVGSFGLYQPQFAFETSEQFKKAIEINYDAQKKLIKEDKAVVSHIEWTVAGSKTEGKKMTLLYKKLMLYAFNGECDGIIAKVKWNNAEKMKERINKAFDSINKLGTTVSIEINKAFLKLKLDEFALTYEYEQKKYEEKEEQKMIREQMREEEKAQREIERAQKEAEDEERRFQKSLEKAKAELNSANPKNMERLAEKVRLLEEQLKEAHDKKERAIALAQLTKVGHIYVISNVGSFGENVYKIGMTRRLDPHDRVRELGDASVPFQFDVHAIIYSENAPQLENELHRKFAANRLNRINAKKEFFRVTLDEIEFFVNQHTNASIEFTKLAEAREYRETVALIEKLNAATKEVIKEESKFPSAIV